MVGSTSAQILVRRGKAGSIVFVGVLRSVSGYSYLMARGQRKYKQTWDMDREAETVTGCIGEGDKSYSVRQKHVRNMSLVTVSLSLAL